MPRFLVVGGDAGGDLPPLLSVVAELTRRGNEVDFLAAPWMPSHLDNPGILDSVRRRAGAVGAHVVCEDSWAATPADAFSAPPFHELAAFDTAVVGAFYVPMATSIGDAVERRLGTTKYDAVAFGVGAFTA